MMYYVLFRNKNTIYQTYDIKHYSQLNDIYKYIDASCASEGWKLAYITFCKNDNIMPTIATFRNALNDENSNKTVFEI